VREAIASAFPVVDLVDQLGEQPHAHLADCRDTVLEAKGPYEKELAQRQDSFGVVPWNSLAMSAASRSTRHANPIWSICAIALRRNTSIQFVWKRRWKEF
jgi:hypothetical protein